MSSPRLRIAQVAPPLEAVPPPGYGGTERVVDVLVRELVRRGHDVTLFASGDSRTPARLVPTVKRALRPQGLADNPTPYILATLDLVLRHDGAFDVVHAHLGWAGVVLARTMATPVVNTFHSRLDEPWAATFLADPPPGLVAISAAQASPWPAVDWTVVHNGLDLDDTPFGERPTDDLCFVGRFTPDKGVVEAVAIARATGRRLRVAAKEPATAAERAYHDEVFLPAARGTDVEYLGELARPECDRLFAESFATLMPGVWPEPFGLVAIESLACGTPVVAHALGALPEIVRDGVDGVLAPDPATLVARFDEVGRLDRRAIRASVLERFSAGRMADGYEAVYARALERGGGTSRLRPVMARPVPEAGLRRVDRSDRSG